MKRLLLFIIALSLHLPVAADWVVEKKIDLMTDETKKTAVVKNKTGHSFSIYRISEGGPVWGNFSLSDGMFDQVDWEKPPMYRVDKHEPSNLARLKRAQESSGGIIHAYAWEPKWVNFVIWHGKEDEGMSRNLVQLMKGQKVVFRYYLSTGGHKDTSFTLAGAESAISGAIGINSEIDHSAQQTADDFKKAYLAESKKCQQNMSTFKSCFSKVNDCRKQADNDIDKFNSCID